VKYRLVIAYDGTAYQGWQVQKIGTGVQEKVETALAAVMPSAPRLHSSSRTDTGVHALGMVAHFEVPPAEARIPGRKLLLALNAHLPADIRIVSAARARSAFHARFDATAKEYRYIVWNHAAMNPLLSRHAWHFPRRLDLPAMRAAARHFVGRHDFAAFTANPGYARVSTVRTVHRCDVRRSGAQITIVIVGSGFLYKMCRGIVGTLVQVGVGRFSPDAMREMLASRDRQLAGMTAPALGLVLWKVSYRKLRGADAEPVGGDDSTTDDE
jgi:tRNA pseudouridine38-40 synthase